MVKHFTTFIACLLCALVSRAQCDATFTSAHITCDSLAFTAVADSNYIHYWSFGDGTYSYDQNPTHQYSNSGTYMVTQGVYDPNYSVCSDGFTSMVEVNCVNGSCDAAFTYTHVTCDSLYFTALSANGNYDYYWDFGDGSYSTDASPAHAFSEGLYTVSLEVTDSANLCSNFYTMVISIDCNPTPCYIDLSANVVCDSVYFTSTAGGGGNYAYAWNFGDGTYAYTASAFHEYSNDGNYLVTVSIYDSTSNCFNNDSAFVQVSSCGTQLCTVGGDLTWSVDTTNCHVQFTSMAYGGTAPYSYQWNFGDGSTSTQANPSHQYPNGTTWTPTLTITDANGCDTTIYDVVYVACAASTPCSADFTFTSVTCDSFYFVAVSGNYAYSWNFGDGTYGSGQYQAHQYTSDGTYTVVLEVLDTLTQCSDLDSAIVQVSCGTQPCTVGGDFTWITDSANCDIHFISTAFGGTPPYSYLWNFGDGTTGTQASPTHQYPNGTWTPMLTITDANGCDTTIYDVVYVACVNDSCSVDISYAHVTCDSVYFLSTGAGSGNYAYYWTFGDGAYSYDSSPAHQYSSDGTYWATLAVFDSIYNCQAYDSILVNISCGTQPCTVGGDFTWITDSASCDIHFISTAFGGTPPYSYLWNFGDGTTGTQASPTHQYPNGTWTPMLTITDANGCDTTIYNVVYVQCGTNGPCCNLSTDFTWWIDSLSGTIYFAPAVSNGTGPYAYLWNFGDGITSTQPNPTHQYGTTGIQLPSLTVTDANGCQSVIYHIMQVSASPTAGLHESENVEINVYPNPGTGIYHVQVSKAAELMVLDLNGKQLMQTSCTGNCENIILNLNNLSDGVYMLVISDEHFRETRKLIKQ